MDLKLLDILIPDDLKDISLPSAKELDYWKARENRIFYIDYEIDDNYSLFSLGKTIINMNISEKDIPESDLKPIYIYIMSYGGDIDQAFYFCDLVESSRIPIVTVATGSAMSAAFLILLAGKRRYAFNHSQLLIHTGSAQIGGTAEQVAEASENYKKQINSMKDFIISHTEIDDKIFKKNQRKDWYLTPEEIKKYQICTIVNRFEDIR